MKTGFIGKLAPAALIMICSAVCAAEFPQGLGAYTTTLHAGGERTPPTTIYRTSNMTGPVPTNKWYSSLLFTQWSQPLFAQPASYRATPEGFEIGLPTKTVAENPSREENDIVYPHVAALTIAPLGFSMKDARADKISDWALDIVMGDGVDGLKATIAHGSPFSYYQVSRGDIRIRSAEAAQVFYRDPQGKTLGIRVDGMAFAVFAPNGTRWGEQGDRDVTMHLPGEARYFAIAALPDSKQETIIEFKKYAYAFISDTHVGWRYDPATSTVITTFSVTTEVKEGDDHGTLMGLYPHQWYKNPALDATLPFEYDTVRGKLKLVSGDQFQTRNLYPGILPYWPGLRDTRQAARLKTYLDADLRVGPEVTLGRGGTYWQGKGLGRTAQLLSIAEQQGDRKRAAALLQAMKTRLESWLRSQSDGNTYFYYDRMIGTLIGYPDEYGTASEINDHHFHYGYWIFAAAEIALRDPAWAAKEKWGSMIDMLIADIATVDRAHAKFPFLRNFDPYESHSWASGTAPFFDGNNQESSSEAINAWAGVILWGEATGNKSLRDTGIYLYTSEIQAVNHYWFDLQHQVLAPEYKNLEACIVWGNKYVHSTWWTEDPREIHGINLLPITTASLYLGADPGFVKRNIDAMNVEFEKYLKSDRKRHASPQIWQDILTEYYALHDPAGALARWDPNGMVEDGETSAHTYFWLQSLVNMGPPDFRISADTPLYSVFRKPGGQALYLAYNADDRKKLVHFSDGKQLLIPARSLGQSFSQSKRANTISRKKNK